MSEPLEPISFRKLAAILGVDEKSVRKAIHSGRLKDSIGVDAKGKRQVVDVARARQEWTDNASKVRTDKKSAQSAAIETGAVPGFGTLNEAQRMATLERARRLKMENDLREGLLVEVGKANREAFESQRIIREAILNIPARLSAELAAEPDPARVYLRLDAALREALTEIADTLEREPVDV